MSEEKYTIIGGSWDRRTIRVPDIERGGGYIRLSKRLDYPYQIGGGESPVIEDMKATTEKYIAWDLTFQDTAGEVRKWNLLRHEDLSEAEAFGMILEGYSMDIQFGNLTTGEEE